MRLQEEAQSMSRFVLTGQVTPSPAWEHRHREKGDDKCERPHCLPGACTPSRLEKGVGRASQISWQGTAELDEEF